MRTHPFGEPPKGAIRGPTKAVRARQRRARAEDRPFQGLDTAYDAVPGLPAVALGYGPAAPFGGY